MLTGIIGRLRLGMGLLGIVAMAVSPLPLPAAGIISTSVAPIDGVVAAATDTTLVIHPPIGSDVTLILAGTTRIRPNGQHAAGASSPGSIVGQYARALYDPNTLAAAQVVLRPRVPLPAVGVVHEASAAGFSLMLGDGRILSLAVDAQTVLRLNGRPATSSQLGMGDRVQALFLLESSANRALRVNAQMVPPRSFQGGITMGKGHGTTSPSSLTQPTLPVLPTTLGSATVPVTPPKPENLPDTPDNLPGKPANLPGKPEKPAR